MVAISSRMLSKAIRPALISLNEMLFLVIFGFF